MVEEGAEGRTQSRNVNKTNRARRGGVSQAGPVFRSTLSGEEVRTNRMDISTVQVNGQRRVRRNSSESEASEGFEIFIQNLPLDCYEKEIWPLLERFGEVTELRLMMNFSGLTRGFCYAKFLRKEAAYAAIRGLNSFQIRPDSPRLLAQISLDKKNLFIGKLPPNLQDTELVKLLTTLTPDIATIDRCRGTSNGRPSYIVKYKTHTAAAAARRILIPYRVQIFQSEDVIVEWARRKQIITTAPQVKYQPNRMQPMSCSPAETPASGGLTAFSRGRPLRRTYQPPPAPEPLPTFFQYQINCGVGSFCNLLF